MAIGPGKYDDLAHYVLEQAQADGVIVIVINGARGHGMSVKATPEMARALPYLLRQLADGI
jgi:hypothetical protein